MRGVTRQAGRRWATVAAADAVLAALPPTDGMQEVWGSNPHNTHNSIAPLSRSEH